MADLWSTPACFGLHMVLGDIFWCGGIHLNRLPGIVRHVERPVLAAVQQEQFENEDMDVDQL